MCWRNLKKSIQEYFNTTELKARQIKKEFEENSIE